MYPLNKFIRPGLCGNIYKNVPPNKFIRPGLKNIFENVPPKKIYTYNSIDLSRPELVPKSYFYDKTKVPGGGVLNLALRGTRTSI